MKKAVCIALVCCLWVCCAHAQRIIHGHVYGGTNSGSPADSIRLVTSSGSKSFTDKLGNYSIAIRPDKDTLYLLYKDREMTHFTLTQNTIPDTFNIYLNNPGFFSYHAQSHELPAVKVHTKNYHEDSLSSRQKYEDIFNYEKPKFRYGKEWMIIPPIFASVDIDNLIRLAQIKRTKQKWRDKQFALDNEKQAYIDSRFTRSLNGSITHLDDDKELSIFMEYARPTASQLRDMNDLELDQYIADEFEEYKRCKIVKKAPLQSPSLNKH